MSQTSDPIAAQKPTDRAPLAIIISLLLVDSLHFVFARLLAPHLPATTSTFYYITLAFLQVFLYAAIRRRIDWRILREHLRFFLVIGFLIAASTAISMAAVFYIDPGTASLLAQTGILFSLGFGVFWLRERLAPLEKAGAVLAILGVAIISFQWGGTNTGLWLGTLLVLTSTFLYALHAAIVKKYGGEMDFLNFFLYRMATASFFLLLFTVARGELIWPTGREVWLILLLTATVNVTISRALYYIALRRYDLSILTIILTLSPVITILWSMLLFQEAPSMQGLLGGTAVIMGVMLVTISRRARSTA